MTKILGLSGKKQSGKNTAVNYILGRHMLHFGIVKERFKISDEGELRISDLFGDEECYGTFDIMRQNDIFENFRKNNIDPYVKVYSFADLLKKEVCMKILGLTYEQCFGTDEDKNSMTDIGWSRMPGTITSSKFDQVVNMIITLLGVDYNENNEEVRDAITGEEDLNLKITEGGTMTAREVMQYVGTDIFRKMYHNVWVDATIRQIENDKSDLAIVCDCRFPNEVEGLQKVGGKVVRLLRAPFSGQDEHESEIALDSLDKDGFDATIDNREHTIDQQCQAIHETLFPWGYIPVLKTIEEHLDK